MRQQINKYLERRRHIKREQQALREIPVLSGSSAPLKILTPGDLNKLLNCPDLQADWSRVQHELDVACQIEDGTTGGVNPGDRRAVWYLIRGLNARSVLEIGTHVGASTVHIAS